MKHTWSLALAGIVCLAAIPARADVLYTTFGSTSPGYTSPSGYTFTGSAGWDVAFTPSVTGTLESADFALMNTGAAGTYQFQVTANLLADSAGAPGAVIASFDTSADLPASTTMVLSLNSTSNPVLSAGTPYWIQIAGVSPNTIDEANWEATNGGSTSKIDETLLGLATPFGTDLPSPAFDIVGTTGPTGVPEPATWVFAGSGLAALALIRKRRLARR